MHQLCTNISFKEKKRVENKGYILDKPIWFLSIQFPSSLSVIAWLIKDGLTISDSFLDSEVIQLATLLNQG